MSESVSGSDPETDKSVTRSSFRLLEIEGR
jgi:hypothetical protein